MKKIIYKKEKKEIEFKLDLERNTIWATQNEMAKLFNVGRSWIARQAKEIGENDSTCSYYEQVAPNGKEYKMKHYSLNLILEIGYKIDVNKTLEFKDWANNLFGEYKSIDNVKSPMPVEIFEDGNVKLEVYINPSEETIWLTQKQLSELFEVDKSTISKHIKNILIEGELDNSVVAKNATTGIDGKVYIMEYYNLDMIISIGYRVSSKRGIIFRIWSNKVLKQYLTKGYAIDETRVTMYKENYIELNNTVLRLEGRVNNVENKIELYDNEVLKQNERITNLEIKKNEEINNMIFYQGELYDAYSFIVKLIKKATKEIVLIDNYVDITTLDILSNKNNNVNLTIITNSNLTNTSINTFNKQYPTLTVKSNNTFHDRFLILDNSELYLIGSSIKDAGKRCFAISEMDKDILNKLTVII